MITKTCGNCNKSIVITNDRNKPVNFCSRACFVEYKNKTGFYKRQTEIKRQGKFVVKKCERCGKDFEIKMSAAKRGRGKYCSVDCAYSGTHEIKHCLICGKEIKVKKSHAASKKYCSIECRSAGYVKFGTLSGENAPRYIDGKSTSKEYDCRKSHKRRAAKKSNGGNYSLSEWAELCEKYDNKCLCCGAGGVKLTVDHIIPISMGGSNSIDNLQPLCISCNSKKSKKVIDYRYETI